MIAIVDYGLGNINAIYTVFNNLNIPVVIASTSAQLEKCDKIILPGVGAFDYAMSKLSKSGMRDTLDKLVINDKKIVLGICVGMQMLTKCSEEGSGSGLAWIDAEVKKFDQNKFEKKISIPHMGWNNIIVQKNNPLLKGFESEAFFYFLHSYYCETNSKNNILSLTKYGHEFASAINCGNIFGVQFHPEKSHDSGIKLLKNFSEL